MSLKKALLLSIVVSLLVLFIAKVELPRETAKKEAGLLLKAEDARSIESITVRRGSEPTFTLINSSPSARPATGGNSEEGSRDLEIDKWQLNVGGRIVDTLLESSSLSSAVAEATSLNLPEPLPANEVEGDLSVYGLDKPVITIEVKVVNSPNTRTFKFGKVSEYSGERYFIEDGKSEVYLLPEGLFTAVNKGSEAFRRRVRIDIAENNISDIELKRGDSDLLVKKSKPGVWEIQRPIQAMANPEKIAEVLRQLQTLRVASFIDDEPAIPGIVKEGRFSGQVVVHHADEKGKPSTINLFTDPAGGGRMFMTMNDSPLPVLVMEGDSVMSIVLDADTLREKRFARFGKDTVQEFNTQNSDGVKFAARKDGAEWKIDNDPGDSKFVEGFINDLDTVEAVGFFAADPGTIAEAARLTVKTNDSKERTIVIGPTQDSSKLGDALLKSVDHSGLFRVVGVLSGDDKKWFVVKDEAINKLLPKRETLLAAKVESTPSSSVATESGATDTNADGK